MKTPHYLLVCLATALLGLGLLGCKTSAPTRLEQSLFDLTTNQVVSVASVPVVVQETNVVVYDSPQTGLAVWETNIVSVTNYRTVSVTNEEYAYLPGNKAEQIVESGSALGNLFGMGGIVGTVLGGLFGLWGQMRSSKSNKTAAALAQIIETGSKILKTTPQGLQLDSQWKKWMLSHQTEQGVVTEVLRLLQTTVDEPSAQVTAQKLLDLMKPQT